EQAQLARSEQALEVASKTPVARVAGANGHVFEEPHPAPAPANSALGLSSGRDSSQTDKDKREYQSLSASNVALSYRKQTAPATDSSAVPSLEALTRMLPPYAALAALQPGGMQTAATKAGLAPAAPSQGPEPRGEKHASQEI